MKVRATRCQGTTLKGKQCSRTTRGTHCPQHSLQIKQVEKEPVVEELSSDDESPAVPLDETTEKPHRHKCPVCLEKREVMRLECGHFLDEECASSMNDDRCPICRREMSCLPKKVKRSIARNARKLLQEQEEANFDAALREQIAELSSFTTIGTSIDGNGVVTITLDDGTVVRFRFE